MVTMNKRKAREERLSSDSLTEKINILEVAGREEVYKPTKSTSTDFLDIVSEAIGEEDKGVEKKHSSSGKFGVGLLVLFFILLFGGVGYLIYQVAQTL